MTTGRAAGSSLMSTSRSSKKDDCVAASFDVDADAGVAATFFFALTKHFLGYSFGVSAHGRTFGVSAETENRFRPKPNVSATP